MLVFFVLFLLVRMFAHNVPKRHPLFSCSHCAASTFVVHWALMAAL